MAIEEEHHLHAALSRLEGTWRTTGRMLDDAEGPDALWDGHDIYEWFPGGHHLVHRVDVRIFGGRNESLEILTPRAGSATTCDQTSFAADGTVEHSTGTFDAQGQYHIDAGGARAVLAVDGPDSMSATWDRLDPDGTWVPWMQVAFDRVAPPHIEVRSKSDHLT